VLQVYAVNANLIPTAQVGKFVPPLIIVVFHALLKILVLEVKNVVRDNALMSNAVVIQIAPFL
jgi:hypothetical protein